MVLSEKQPLLIPSVRPMEQRYVLVVHGGAGIMSREGSTPAQRAAYKAGLCAALVAVCLLFAASQVGLNALPGLQCSARRR